VTCPRRAGTFDRSGLLRPAARLGRAQPTTALPNRLDDNLRAVRERIARACERCGRAPGSVRLVVVTKSVTPQVCAALAGLGQLDLAENRAQALGRKALWCSERNMAVRWHFLGHVQRNKARSVVCVAEEIHSVDSLRLLEALERIAAEERRRPRIYLEVDFTQVSVRTGLAPQEVPALARAARGLQHVALVGLMTIAPLPAAGADDPLHAARRTFARLRALRDELPPELFQDGRALLSMGMSSDFELAIEQGADIVRVGSALFEGLGPQPGALLSEGAL